MSTAAGRARPLPADSRQPRPLWRRPGRGLDEIGPLAWFTVTVVGQIGRAAPLPAETVRLIAQIGMGTGAMAVVGGTVGDRRVS